MNQIEQMIHDLCPDGVEWKKLGEIGTIYRGTSFQKKHFVEKGVPCIHYGQIYTYYGTSAHKTISFVSEDIAKGRTLAKTGDVVITTTSENLEDVGKAVAWLGNSDIMVSNHACFFRHKQDPKYIAYYLQTPQFFKFKREYSRGVKVIDLSPADLENFEIPVPPLPLQHRIVEILDKFTELEAKLEAELQAELDCRKQQYEFYRNQLLTFPNGGGYARRNVEEAE